MGEGRAKRLPNRAAVKSRDRPCLDSDLTYCGQCAALSEFCLFYLGNEVGLPA